MQLKPHHELDSHDLHVTICVPEEEHPALKTEIKTRIVQACQSFTQQNQTHAIG